MNFDSNPFITSLLTNEDIQRNRVRQLVEDACLKARFITRRDIETKSARYVEMQNLVEDHFVCSELLKQIMPSHGHSEDDSNELFKTIIQDIVERIMSSRAVLPRRC